MKPQIPVIDHNKIIADVANEYLRPAGLIRKGKSRVWLDDHGWFTIMLEYQPSGYQKGTHLNIGICFHWHKYEYFTFDYTAGFSSRECGFVIFDNPQQFRDEVVKLTIHALKRIDEYRKFTSFKHAKMTLLFHTSRVPAHIYDRAMLCFMLNNRHKGLYYLKNVKVRDVYVDKHNQEIKFFNDLSKSRKRLRSYMTDLIQESRALKKLPKMDICLPS